MDAKLEKRILFVCTGNTCRSPMAESLFNHQFSGRALFFADGRPVTVRACSAGVAAHDGEEMSFFSKVALKELKGDERDLHFSQSVSSALIKEADLVLGMTDGHRSILQQNFPVAKEKIFSFSDFFPDEKGVGSSGEDIPDPFGRPLGVYKAAALEIRARLQEIWPGIKFFLGIQEKKE